MKEGLELIFKRIQRLIDLFGPLSHGEGSSYTSEPWSRLVNCRMLYLPEKPCQHRNDLVFTPDALARVAVAMVFKRENLSPGLHGVGGPGTENPTQSTVHFEDSFSRKNKNPKPRQIVQVCQGVPGRLIVVKSGSL